MTKTKEWLNQFRYLKEEQKALKRDGVFPDRVVEIERSMKEILTAIDSVRSPELHTLLILRYVSGLPWEGIAEALGREDVKWTRTAVHNRALSEVEKWRQANDTERMCEM